MTELLNTPIDVVLREADFPRLGSVEYDPFEKGIDSLVEAYLMGVTVDFIRSRVGILFGLWAALSVPAMGNVGLLIFSEISEFGWKAQGFDIPTPPHWWVTLEHGFAEGDEPLGVEIIPLKGRKSLFTSGQEPKFRYKIGLEPASQLVVTFRSATYIVGSQDINYEDVFHPGFSSSTRWHASSHWPR